MYTEESLNNFVSYFSVDHPYKVWKNSSAVSYNYQAYLLIDESEK